MSNYPPIQTSTTAYISTPETLEELEAQNERLQGERSGFENTVAQLTVRITDLESALATEKQYRSSHYDNYKNLLAQVDYFIESLANYVKDGNMDIEVAEDFAECFGRELTRKVYGRISIYGDIELEIPAYLDLDDIGDELDISIGQSYTSTVRVDYSDVSLVEVEEN